MMSTQSFGARTFLSSAALALAGTLGIGFSAMAWEPPVAQDTTNPGWYRAGETSPHADQGGGGSDWSGASRQDQYGSSTGDGYSSEYRYQWKQPGSAGTQDAPAAGGGHPADWRNLDGYSPDLSRDRSSGWSAANPAASGYRFRGDTAPRHGWPAPAGPWGNQHDGYRFRDDKRLESRRPATAVDPRYHFRPLEPEDSATKPPSSRPQPY